MIQRCRHRPDRRVLLVLSEFGPLSHWKGGREKGWFLLHQSGEMGRLSFFRRRRPQ